MILLSGGTDGGTVSHVVEMAEYIAAARPKPRLGHSYSLPVIYAGNREARDEVEKTIGEYTTLHITENLRPTLERENLFPARQEIQDLFMEHVMAQAPGYGKLREWTAVPIMPTPAAVGSLIRAVSEREKINAMGVDIGGATTDVFSVFGGVFNRTVSANLGMSYSVSNVLAEAGIENVLRWVPFEIDEEDLRDRIKNKMIRPTTIPQTLESLSIEQALAREALRLALEQHRMLAVGLKGVQQERSVSDVFDLGDSGESLVDMMELDLLIGSGGVLSHAPRREQAMLMLMDSYRPEGITRLAVDSIFMMPHLGVLAEVDADAATEIFERDCLIELGTCVAPVGKGKPGKDCLEYTLRPESGEEVTGALTFGGLIVHPLGSGEEARLIAKPSRGFDLGEGKGKEVEVEVKGGIVGVVMDGRGRPLKLAEGTGERNEQLRRWSETLGIPPPFPSG